MNTRCLLILIGIVFLHVFPIQAQWRLGGEVGVTMSRLKVKGSESVLGPTLGFTADYQFKSQVVIMSGLSFTRKGGSNLAATLVNSILCFDDAEQLKPGRDV